MIMPPKNRPVRRKKQDGELNLKEVAAERIDAVTAEPLHAAKFVEIKSPDGTLRIFYNTATLIRIATDRGMFMQPPHFREEMTSSLRKEIEKIEGRTFHFEKRNVFLSGTDNADSGMHVFHRHVYFDQIIDEFYLLNPAEIYVCPACYLHWVTTRYASHITALRQRLDYLDDDADPVVDPLDVLAHMQGVERPYSNEHIDDNNDEAMGDGSSDLMQVPLTIPSTNGTSNWDSPLTHIVFRRAAHWKQHVRQHHQDTHTSAADYRLRDFLCQYFARFNRLSDERNKRRVDRGEEISVQPELTLSRYWHMNARFNRLRYNRIVEAVEQAGPYISECVGRMAFTNENIMNTFHDPAGGTSDDDDFICDDSESESMSENTDNSRSEPSTSFNSEDGESDATAAADDDDDDDDYDGEEENSNKKENGKGKLEHVVRTQKPPRSKGNAAAAASLSFSSSLASSSSSSSLSSSSSSPSSLHGNDVTERNPGTGCNLTQRNIFKRGLLAPLPDSYRKLTYDERCVLDSFSKRVFKPTVLYNPRNTDLKNSEGKSDEEIDWSQVGGTIEDTKDYVQERRRQRANSAIMDYVPQKKLRCSAVGNGQSTKSPLNEGEKASTNFISPARSSKLLLDDDLEIPQEGTPTPGKRFLLLMDEPDSS